MTRVLLSLAIVLGSATVAADGTPDPHGRTEEEIAASAARGAKVFQTCAACHTLRADADEPYFGPHLVGIFGRRPAADPGYGYSKALRALDDEWTWDRLAEFLRRPRSFVPGTTMVQALPDSQKVVDVLTYMRAVQDSTRAD